jgi:hypothetical protein
MNKNIGERTARKQDEYVCFDETEKNVAIVHNNFGVLDERGRMIGAKIRTSEITRTKKRMVEFGCMCLESQLGFHYEFIPQATRDGKPFGASQLGDIFRTIEERNVAIKKYLESARKRAVNR